MREREIRQAAARLLRGNLRQGISPFDGSPYSFSVPSNITYPYQWFWDSCFHAIVWTYFDIEQAKAELRTLLRAQSPDGRIPHRICWEKRLVYPYRFYLQSGALLHPVRSQLVQPPVLAEALENVYERSGDGTFLAETLPKVERFYHWLARHRDPDGDDLVSIIHPYESGLDHKPAYDLALGLRRPWATATVLALRSLDVSNRLLGYNLSLMFRLDRFNVEDVLYNCIYAQGLMSLSRLCQAQGDATKGEAYRRWGQRVESAILQKCRGPDGLFYDLYSKRERQARVKTVTSLFPLILDSTEEETVEELVKEHLLNEGEFWPPYPVPTCALSEKAFNPSFRSVLASGLWRGPTWVSTNWYLVRGLAKHGYGQVARVIVGKTRQLIEKEGFREFYNPYSGQAMGARGFAWSTLIVDMLAQYSGRR